MLPLGRPITPQRQRRSSSRCQGPRCIPAGRLAAPRTATAAAVSPAEGGYLRHLQQLWVCALDAGAHRVQHRRCIKKLMSTESDAPAHTSARMIKLATGVALTSCSTGQTAHLPCATPVRPQPARCLHGHAQLKTQQNAPGAETTRCQNSACGKGCKRVRTACTGETGNTSCPTAMAAHCYTASRRLQRPAAEKIVYVGSWFFPAPDGLKWPPLCGSYK